MKRFEYDFMHKLTFYMRICEQKLELSMKSYSETFCNLGARSGIFDRKTVINEEQAKGEIQNLW